MHTALAAAQTVARGPEAMPVVEDFLDDTELALWDEASRDHAHTLSYVGASMLAGTSAGARQVHWMDEVTLSLNIRPIPSGQSVIPLAPEPGPSRLNFAQWRAGVSRARDEGVLPPTVTEPEEFVPPPEGFRAPSREEFHDTTGMDDDRMQQVLEGLHKL